MLLIDIRSDESSNGWINRLITNPLAENMGVFVTFTYTVLAILAVIIAFRIFSNWQAGNSDNIISDISKWALGMLLCVCLLVGLKTWVALNPVPASSVDINF